MPDLIEEELNLLSDFNTHTHTHSLLQPPFSLSCINWDRNRCRLYSLNIWPLRLVRPDASEQLQLIMNVESGVQAVSLRMS